MVTRREIFRVLDTVGDGTGVTNAIGDYSSTETSFRITDPDKHFYITRMLVQIEDSGSFATSGYGALAGLTNGIHVHVSDANEVVDNDLTDQLPIKSNNDWARVCYDLKLENWASGNSAVHARWTFTNAGHPIRVEKNHHFEVVLNDNFTGLVSHYFFAQGFSSGAQPSQ
jgi:hypothetical protein